MRRVRRLADSQLSSSSLFEAGSGIVLPLRDVKQLLLRDAVQEAVALDVLMAMHVTELLLLVDAQVHGQRTHCAEHGVSVPGDGIVCNDHSVGMPSCAGDKTGTHIISLVMICYRSRFGAAGVLLCLVVVKVELASNQKLPHFEHRPASKRTQRRWSPYSSKRS